VKEVVPLCERSAVVAGELAGKGVGSHGWTWVNGWTVVRLGVGSGVTSGFRFTSSAPVSRNFTSNLRGTLVARLTMTCFQLSFSAHLLSKGQLWRVARRENYKAYLMCVH